MATAADIALTIAFALLVLVNLIGNTLVCIIVLKNQAMKTTMNYLLVNLAVADVLVAFSLVPQYVLNLAFDHPPGEAGDYLCRLLTGGGWLWFGDKVSLYILVVIAFERYFVVVHPFTGRERLSGTTLRVVLILCWTLNLLLNIPNFTTPTYEPNPEFHCPQRWSHPTLAKVYTVLCYFIFGAIPLATIVYLYTRVVYFLWDRDFTPMSSSHYSNDRNRKKITKMVIIVTFLFGVLRAPNLVTYMLSQFDPDTYTFGSTSYIASVALVALNSTFNPFVYSLHSTNFRRHLIGMFHCTATKKVRGDTACRENTPLLDCT